MGRVLFLHSKTKIKIILDWKQRERVREGERESSGIVRKIAREIEERNRESGRWKRNEQQANYSSREPQGLWGRLGLRLYFVYKYFSIHPLPLKPCSALAANAKLN